MRVIDCASRLDTAALPVLMPGGGHFAVTLPSFPRVIFDPLLNSFRSVRRHTLRLETDAAQIAQVLALVAEGRVPVRLDAVPTRSRKRSPHWPNRAAATRAASSPSLSPEDGRSAAHGAPIGSDGQRW